MLPRDDEDFSTLHSSEFEPEPIPVLQRSPPPNPPPPKPPPPKPPEVTILSMEPLAAICSRIQLSDRAQQAATTRATPLEFFDSLVRIELFEDATRFLAHALPQCEAVGWAYFCARQVHSAPAAAPIEAALAAARAWVRNPENDERLAAGKAAEKAGLQTPAGRVAAAAFLSGPNYDLPIALRKVRKNTTAIGVSAAVLAAAVWNDAEKKTGRFVRFLAEGRRIACGARPLDDAASAG
jgi:hypothetical protein